MGYPTVGYVHGEQTKAAGFPFKSLSIASMREFSLEVLSRTSQRDRLEHVDLP